MAILKSTLVNGDLTVTGSLNVQGDLTYVGVKNLRVKDKQIELNATDSGSAAASGEAANGAGIVFKGTTKNSSPEASILYDYSDDTLVVNKTIKGTVASANNAASADKVANKLTVNVTDETGSKKTVTFDGSAAETVSVDLSGLQRQINSLTGGAGSIATQINDAISALNVTDAAEDGKYVSSVSETAGKITVTRAALPDYTEVYDKKGAAAQALADAKEYANGLNTTMDGRVQALEGNVAKWNGKQDALSTDQLNAVNSGITEAKVGNYEAHVANNDIHVIAADKVKWNAAEGNAKAYADGLAKNYDAAGAAATAETNAKNYTDTEIEKLGLGTAAQKNVLTGTIADSSSSDNLVTAAQVKAYAAGVVGAMHFRGAVTSTDDVANPASGDICLVGTKEYVYNGTEWVLFGDESAYDGKGSAATAEKNAKDYADSLAKNYAKASHTHKIADIADLQATLDGKAAVDHNHDDVYSKLGHTHATSEITGLDNALAGKQNKLDEAQLRAVNSGITATTVATYDAHVADATKHITADERKAWNAAQTNAEKHADEKVAELKNTVDSLSADVLKGVAAGNYVSVSTKSGNSQTISVTTKKVADASDSANGLALAADVKKYVDDKNALQNTEIDTIKSNITSIQGNYVQKAGDTMTGKLTMNAADIEMSNNGTNGIVFGDMKIVWNSTDNAIEFIPKTA